MVFAVTVDEHDTEERVIVVGAWCRVAGLSFADGAEIDLDDLWLFRLVGLGGVHAIAPGSSLRIRSARARIGAT